jgi:hypothetical protein
VTASYALGENAEWNIFREITIGDTVDFQVEMQVGYYSIRYIFIQPFGTYFTGETSGWSDTQTLTIGESQTPTPSPVATPTSAPYQEP